jgi:hypothetical protein
MADPLLAAMTTEVASAATMTDHLLVAETTGEEVATVVVATVEATKGPRRVTNLLATAVIVGDPRVAQVGKSDPPWSTLNRLGLLFLEVPPQNGVHRGQIPGPISRRFHRGLRTRVVSPGRPSSCRKTPSNSSTQSSSPR